MVGASGSICSTCEHSQATASRHRRPVTLEVRAQPGGDGRALVGALDLGNAQTLERAVPESEHLDVVLRGRTPLHPRNAREGPHWDLNLAADLPATLTVRSGVGETMVDLRGTAVHGLVFDAGIGDHAVYLPDGVAVSAPGR